MTACALPRSTLSGGRRSLCLSSPLSHSRVKLCMCVASGTGRCRRGARVLTTSFRECSGRVGQRSTTGASVSYRGQRAAHTSLSCYVSCSHSRPRVSLTPQQAAEFSGHSLRHCLPCLARALALPMEDRDELGRWVIDSRGPGTGPRAGRVESLSNRSSDEAASPRVVDIIQRMLRAMHECVRSEGGVSPRSLRWAAGSGSSRLTSAGLTLCFTLRESSTQRTPPVAATLRSTVTLTTLSMCEHLYMRETHIPVLTWSVLLCL